LSRALRRAWPWIAVSLINLGAVILFAFQMVQQKRAYLALRSEDGFLFLESLNQNVQAAYRQNPVEPLSLVRETFDHLMQYEELAYLILETPDRIEYENPDGIHARDLGSMTSDPLLMECVYSGEGVTQVIEIGGREVLEAVWPVYVDQRFMGILRAGLRLDFVHLLERDLARNMGLLLALILALDILFVVSLRLSRRLGMEGLKWQTVMNEIDDGILVLEKDRRFFVNDRFKRLLGSRWDQVPAKIHRDVTRFKQDERHIIVFQSQHTFGRFLVARDMTMEDIAEQAREREQRMLSLGELSSGFAHEVRNPLNTISMLVQCLKPHDGKQLKSQALIQKEIVRLNGIVQDLIDIAKMPRLARTLAPIVPVLNELVEFYSDRARHSGFTIRVDVPQTLPPIEFDAEKTRGVLINLLENALEAESTKIRIAVIIQDRFLKIAIRDNGVGLTPEVQERAFDLYFTTKTGGSGLGLPHVQRIMTAHGGFVTFESSCPGTSVSLFFPVLREESS